MAKRGGSSASEKGGSAAKAVASKGAVKETKKKLTDEQRLLDAQNQLQELATQPADSWEERHETRQKVEKILEDLPVGTVIDTQRNHSVVKTSKDEWISTAITSYRYSNSDMSQDWTDSNRIIRSHPDKLKLYKFDPNEWSRLTVRDVESMMKTGRVDKSYEPSTGFSFFKGWKK